MGPLGNMCSGKEQQGTQGQILRQPEFGTNLLLGRQMIGLQYSVGICEEGLKSNSEYQGDCDTGCQAHVTVGARHKLQILHQPELRQDPEIPGPAWGVGAGVDTRVILDI